VVAASLARIAEGSYHAVLGAFAVTLELLVEALEHEAASDDEAHSLLVGGLAAVKLPPSFDSLEGEQVEELPCCTFAYV